MNKLDEILEENSKKTQSMRWEKDYMNILYQPAQNSYFIEFSDGKIKVGGAKFKRKISGVEKLAKPRYDYYKTNFVIDYLKEEVTPEEWIKKAIIEDPSQFLHFTKSTKVSVITDLETDKTYKNFRYYFAKEGQNIKKFMVNKSSYDPISGTKDEAIHEAITEDYNVNNFNLEYYVKQLNKELEKIKTNL